MIRQVGMPNCRAVGTVSNLDGAARNSFLFTAVFLCFGWHFMPIQSPKNAHIYHCRNDYRLEMINPFYSNNLSLLYHTSVFSIISWSEAVYWRFLLECVNAIYLILYLTHTHTHTLLVVQVHHCYSYACFIM